MASMNEAFVLPLTQKEQKETFKSNYDMSRGSYKTYIHNTNTYKRNTKIVVFFKNLHIKMFKN